MRMSRMLVVMGLVGMIGGLGACGGPARTGCGWGVGTPMAVFTLYFGKAISGRGDLTEQEWQSFLDDSGTVNLADGYTVLEGNGSWMNPVTRKTVREATKVLVAALPETPASVAAVERVRQAYQSRFHQQAVGMTVERACGAF
jgi:hypothetical protein